jgi:hypothetical protein
MCHRNLIFYVSQTEKGMGSTLLQPTLPKWTRNTKTGMKTNGMEDPDMNPHNYIHLIFDKGAQNTFFKECCWENWVSACRKLKLDTCLSPCTNINSKWIKDLGTRPETLKVVQERVRNTVELIGIGNDFLNRTQIAQQPRERIDKWDHMKQKCSA